MSSFFSSDIGMQVIIVESGTPTNIRLRHGIFKKNGGRGLIAQLKFSEPIFEKLARLQGF